ncbi:MAG: multidrug effflux MFS transporter [Legionella sp.]|nr:multidrug effflux MFS transporter [Legionella sp.]
MEKQSHQNAWFLITLALMSMAGLIGTDVYLPALPEMSKSLGQSADDMQLTLGIYLFGLAIGQLFLGPITDCYGRRKILLLSFLLFFVASIGCTFAHSFIDILIYRGLQALGACGGLVIGRAIVADRFQPEEVGKVFATIFPFVGMSPAISPAIGGFIAYYMGWRADFVFMALFAAVIFFLSLIIIPESLALKDRKPLKIFQILSTYPKILFSRQFVYYTIAPCSAYIAFFAYIAQSPFIFHAQGFGERSIGLFYITLSLSYVAGSFTARAAIKRNRLDNVLNVGFKYFLLGAACFLLVGLCHLPLLWMVAAISTITFANGFLIPLGMAGVVSAFPGRAGYASGLLGFLQLGVAGLTSSFIGEISLNQVDRLAEFIFIAVLLSVLIRWILSPAPLTVNALRE